MFFQQYNGSNFSGHCIINGPVNNINIGENKNNRFRWEETATCRYIKGKDV